jgi:hypothetical protein
MNLVKLITDQLSSDALGKLCALLGVDSESAESAAGTAVPSLLAGLAGLATQEEGVRKLTGVLNSLDEGMFGNFDRMLSGDTGGLQQKGGSLLNSLFGDSLSNNLATAISRFTGLDAGTAKSLLAYLLPLVLGRVASQWRNQGGTPGALKNLFADQKRNIADAVPSGFSLDDVPGLGRLGDVARSTAHAAKGAERATRSTASTLLPLALLLLGAFLLWSFWRNRPEAMQAGAEKAAEAEKVTVMKPVAPESLDMPEVTRMKDDLAETVKTFGEALAGIKDAASAEAALPQLEELNRKIDAMKNTLRNLPEAGRTTLQTFVHEQIDPLKRQASDTLSLPGLSERIKTLINEIVRKLEELHVVGASP